jgi:hypothetical protein
MKLRRHSLSRSTVLPKLVLMIVSHWSLRITKRYSLLYQPAPQAGNSQPPHLRPTTHGLTKTPSPIFPFSAAGAGVRGGTASTRTRTPACPRGALTKTRTTNLMWTTNPTSPKKMLLTATTTPTRSGLFPRELSQSASRTAQSHQGGLYRSSHRYSRSIRSE